MYLSLSVPLSHSIYICDCMNVDAAACSHTDPSCIHKPEYVCIRMATGNLKRPYSK